MRKVKCSVFKVRSSALPACLAGGVLILMACAAMAEEPETRSEALSQWMETKRLISKEKQDWRISKQILEDRVSLLQTEIDSLKEKTGQAQEDIGDADEKLRELNDENQQLKDATAGLKASVTMLENRMRNLLDRSPTPIAERVKPLSQRMPDNPDETKATLSERFQNVIGILNEMNKFAGGITEATEVRSLPDGSKAEVTVLYLGLGPAYYCNLTGGIAGMGLPGKEGFSWEQNNDIAQQVADIIAVYRNEKPAAYILVDSKIDTAGETPEPESKSPEPTEETEADTE